MIDSKNYHTYGEITNISNNKYNINIHNFTVSVSKSPAMALSEREKEVGISEKSMKIN